MVKGSLRAHVFAVQTSKVRLRAVKRVGAKEGSLKVTITVNMG